MKKIIIFFYKFLIYKYKGYPISPLKLYKLLVKSQYWDNNQIETYQLTKMNDLIQYAKDKSEYYSKKFSNINLPLKSLIDVKNLPIIDKQTIIKYNERLITNKHNKRFKHTTSGSTGDPIYVYLSGLAESYRRASNFRFLSWWDINPYDKSVLIWGRKRTENVTNNLLDKTKRWLRNRYDINVFNLSEKNIIEHFNEIEKFRPVYIRGYKSAVLQFAELMEKKKLCFRKTKLKVAIVTSEVLMAEERNLIVKVLGCNVANEYGAAEAGLFAYECPSGSMHINEESVYLEIDRNNEVVVTELFNDSMPLINYKIGDKVSLSNTKCKCGRTSRIINSINGRVNDYVLRPDGSKISQYIFYYIIKELDDIGFCDAVLKYKIVQQDNTFSFYIIPGKNFSPNVKKYIEKRMFEEIGKEIIIKFILVNFIEREKSGKLRFFIRR